MYTFTYTYIHTYKHTYIHTYIHNTKGKLKVHITTPTPTPHTHTPTPRQRRIRIGTKETQYSGRIRIGMCAMVIYHYFSLFAIVNLCDIMSTCTLVCVGSCMHVYTPKTNLKFVAP